LIRLLIIRCSSIGCRRIGAVAAADQIEIISAAEEEEEEEEEESDGDEAEEDLQQRQIIANG
jgi:hypothetical protein